MESMVAGQAVTPILGVAFRDADALEESMLWVERVMGEVELVSQDCLCRYNEFYEAGIQPALKSRFYSFGGMADPALLADWKVQTCRLEAEAATRRGEYRPLNLDPGYLMAGKFVRASRRGLAHRVYIGLGIHADVSMNYVGGQWLKHEHTHPDLASGQFDAFFSLARARHLECCGVLAMA